MGFATCSLRQQRCCTHALSPPKKESIPPSSSPFLLIFGHLFSATSELLWLPAGPDTHLSSSKLWFAARGTEGEARGGSTEPPKGSSPRAQAGGEPPRSKFPGGLLEQQLKKARENEATGAGITKQHVCAPSDGFGAVYAEDFQAWLVFFSPPAETFLPKPN